MDPTAPPAPGENENQLPDFILPGQFVVAGGEDTSTQTSPTVSAAMQNPPAAHNPKPTSPVDIPIPSSIVQSEPPKPANSALKIPDEISHFATPIVEPETPKQAVPNPFLSANPAKPTNEELPNIAVPQMEVPKPSVQEDAKSEAPTLPPLNSLQEGATLPPASKNSANSQPDPTPFISPMGGGQNQVPFAESTGKSQKLKNILVSSGAVLLLSIVVGVAYFFIFNKKPLTSASIDTTIIAQLDDLPPLPKRKSGGFADLPPIAPVFAATASAAPVVLIPTP